MKATNKATNKAATKNTVLKLAPISKVDIETETTVTMPTGKATEATVKTFTTNKAKAKANKAKADKAKAKVAAAKAKEKEAKAKAKAKEAQAKAQAKAKEKASKASEAQAKQASALTPREMQATTRKELASALDSFIAHDLGVKASGQTLAAMKAAFHKGATSVKLVPLSKCAHAIGLALGIIAESDDTVSNATCRECYPKDWDVIRTTYNKVASAFKSSMATIADGHKASYSLKASAKVTKKGKAVKTGVVGMTAKVASGKVTDTAVKLTEVLAKNAVQVAMARVDAIGSCVILGKADYLRYVRHFTSRTGKNTVFSISTPPPWMTKETRMAWESKVNDAIERAEVTMAWLQGQARIAAKAKGIKVAGE